MHFAKSVHVVLTIIQVVPVEIDEKRDKCLKVH